MINTDIAVHKLDVTQFLSDKEKEEYPHGPVELCVPPKMFDLSKADRIKMTREELNLMKQEKEALEKEAA